MVENAATREGANAVTSAADRTMESNGDNTAAREARRWTISAPTAWDTSGFAGLMSVLREDRTSTPAALREDRVSRPASWLTPGFHALAVHRFGEWIEAGGPPALLRRPAAVLQRLMWVYVRNILGFEIHPSVRVGRRVRFYHQHGVVIGGPVVIGDDCVFRHGITIAASSKSQAQAPQIGARVSFGAGCVVLGGIRIGDGATIGPNAVVTTDVPPGASVVAQPARLLRIRRDVG